MGHKQSQRSAAAQAALAALAWAWLNAKLAEHPPGLGWVDLAVAVGLAAAWGLGKGEKKD